ncbi:MAG: ribosome silencing factor [Sedimentisphaerales bacterium]|nr:ribosome silencing factor [Sedimentisphaerales bacterium]
MTRPDAEKKDSPFARKINDSRRLACAIARLIEDRHGRDVVVLELAGISPVALHFVIGTGTSEPQIRAIAREAESLGKTSGYSLFGRAGTRQGRWVVVDFVDVVLHLFDEEYRSFYDLELLWGDAPKIDWQEPKMPDSKP